jgi:hypothetical protein
MGIVENILQLFQSLLLGMHDSSREFQENMASAERHMRWGNEIRNIRDFEAAIEHFSKCADADAPRPDLCLRKYTARIECRLMILRLWIEKLRAEREIYKTRREEAEAAFATTQEDIEAAEKKVHYLEKEGLLMKAQEENTLLEENRRFLSHQEETAREEMIRYEREFDTLYRKVSDEYYGHQMALDQELVTLQAVPGIDRGICQSVADGAKREFRTLEEELARYLPGQPESEPAAT